MGTGTGKILEKTVPLVKGIDRGTVPAGRNYFFGATTTKPLIPTP